MIKRILFVLAALLLSAAGLRAQTATPYAVYCEGDQSLRFLCSDEALTVGSTLPGGQTVTELWQGDDVIRTGETTLPGWRSKRDAVTRIVFDESFKFARPTSGYYWFFNFSQTTEIEGLAHLNTSEMTNMSGMFYGCSGLTELDLSHFNTQNVLYMHYMFYGCSKLTSLNLSNFNTGKVTYMSGMFYGCSGLTELDIRNFNTANVTDMNWMFLYCSGLTWLGRSDQFVTAQANTTDMYTGCNPLINATPYAVYCEGDWSLRFLCSNDAINVGSTLPDGQTVTELWKGDAVIRTGTSAPGWNSKSGAVSRVVFDESFKFVRPTSGHRWFSNFQRLTEIEGLAHLNTSEMTDMSSMFAMCLKLRSLDLSRFNTENVNNMSDMFNNCTSTSLDLSSFNTTNVTDMSSMFFGCESSSIKFGNGFNAKNVTDMSEMFYACQELTELDLSHFNTQNVTDMSKMFYWCTSLTSLNLSNSFNTEKVTDMSMMFAFCSKLTSINLSQFNTKNVNDMYGMFANCRSLTSLNLSSFDTRNVTSMYGMFCGCSSLTSLDLSHFNTSKVTQANLMLDDCPSLRLVDLSEATVPDLSSLVSSIEARPLIYVPEGTAAPTGRENIIAGDRCAHLVIDYDDATSEQLLLRAPYPFTAERVTLARDFTAGAPHTLCLPFAVGQGTGGTFYNLKAYDEQTARVRFSPVREAATTPHTPYLFIPAADGHVSFGGDIAVSATTDATTEAATADDVTLCGVYARKTFTADEAATGCYYGWARGEFRQAGEGARADACRAYLRLPAHMAGAPARLAVDFGTDGTTGLDATESPSIESEKPGYDLGGRRVAKGYRGIVVRQGRKQLQR